jgi:sugar lactone lactonase YvrE
MPCELRCFTASPWAGLTADCRPTRRQRGLHYECCVGGSRLNRGVRCLLEPRTVKIMIRTLIIAITAIVMVGMFLADDVSAHPAWGIVVDRNGQIYFSDLETIWKIDAQGKLSVFRAGVSGRHTHELAIDEGGNLYGADYTYESETQRDINGIWKMTPAGGFTYILSPTDSLPRGMSIWRDRDGNTYSVEENNQLKRETLLLKRTPSGNVSVLAGSSYGYADGKGSQAKFSNIIGVAFGPDGSLYVTDGSNVRKVTMDGTVATLARNVMVANASGNPVEGSALFGIAVDPQGNVFVGDHGNRRILKITPDGQMNTPIRSEESWFPTGVAIKGGELYILEESHTPTSQPIGTRVRKLSPDGKVTILAQTGENRTSSENPSIGGSSGESSERVAEPKHNAPYALIGAGIGVFALTFTIWRIRRRVYDRQHRNS